MLSQLWFMKKIYPIFLKQLKLANTEEKSIFHWENGSEELKITIVINNQIILLTKNKNQALVIKKIDLPENITFKTKLDIPVNHLKNYIKLLKHYGVIIDSQHIIEFMNNHLRNGIRYYNLSRQEVAQIYYDIVVHHQKIFENNPPATVMEDKEMKNTWID